MNFTSVNSTNHNALYSFQLFQKARITMKLITSPSNTSIYDGQVIGFIVTVDETPQWTRIKIGI